MCRNPDVLYFFLIDSLSRSLDQCYSVFLAVVYPSKIFQESYVPHPLLSVFLSFLSHTPLSFSNLATHHDSLHDRTEY